MSTVRVSTGLAVALAVTLLAGCSSKPSTADLMRSHATEGQSLANLKTQLAKDWETGQALIESGEDDVKSGEKKVKAAKKDLKKGNDQIERGNENVTKGSKMMREAEQRFREAFPDLTLESAR